MNLLSVLRSISRNALQLLRSPLTWAGIVFSWLVIDPLKDTWLGKVKTSYWETMMQSAEAFSSHPIIRIVFGLLALAFFAEAANSIRRLDEKRDNEHQVAAEIAKATEETARLKFLEDQRRLAIDAGEMPYRLAKLYILAREIFDLDGQINSLEKKIDEIVSWLEPLLSKSAGSQAPRFRNVEWPSAGTMLKAYVVLELPGDLAPQFDSEEMTKSPVPDGQNAPYYWFYPIENKPFVAAQRRNIIAARKWVDDLRTVSEQHCGKLKVMQHHLDSKLLDRNYAQKG